jgi:hypothetical protein
MLHFQSDRYDYEEEEKESKWNGLGSREVPDPLRSGRNKGGLVEQPTLDGYRLVVTGGDVQGSLVVVLQGVDKRFSHTCREMSGGATAELTWKM